MSPGIEIFRYRAIFLPVSDVIDRCCHPILSGTMGTTIEGAFCLDSVANDLAPAVLTPRGKLVNRALEAVERVGMTGGDHLKGQVVIISTYFTPSHGTS